MSVAVERDATLDNLSITTIRTLAIDAVQAANSGHPGTPMYRDAVLPPHVTARVAVEQASTFGWERYAGADRAVIGMETFGASAALKELQTKFGFTPERVVDAALAQLEKTRTTTGER